MGYHARVTLPPIARHLLVPLVLVSTGCSAAESDRFFAGLAEVILVAIVVTALMALIGIVLLVAQIGVIVLNFVRPSQPSMVAGYVLAGLHGFSALASVALLAMATVGTGGNALNDPDIFVRAGFGLIASVGFTALLAGSSWYAQRRLLAMKRSTTSPANVPETR